MTGYNDPSLKHLTIALDYDETYTADKTLWDAFEQLMHERGHRLVMITGRSEKESAQVERDVRGRWVVIYAGKRTKRQAARDERVNVDIWIDDMPEMISDPIPIFSKS